MQPAVDEVDAGHARVKNCAPDILETLLGKGPELLRMVEARALDDVVDVLKIARQYKSQIAARCRPGHVSRFDDRDRPPPLGYLARDGEARKPSPDHANIDVEVEIEPWTVRPCNARRLIPAGFHDYIFPLARRCDFAAARGVAANTC